MKVGNPYLRPQFTDAFEIAHKYSWRDGSLFSAMYHRMIQDQYMRIFSVDNSNPDYDIVNRIYQNTGSATNTGLELLFSQDITNTFKISASFNGFINTIDAYQGTLLFPFVRPFFIEQSSDPAWDTKLTSEFKLPWRLSAQITGVFFSKKNIPQGEELNRTSVDFGLKKTIWNNKGELTLAATDIFNTFGIRQRVVGEGFTATYKNFYETQVIRLGMKYRF